MSWTKARSGDDLYEFNSPYCRMYVGKYNTTIRLDTGFIGPLNLAFGSPTCQISHNIVLYSKVAHVFSILQSGGDVQNLSLSDLDPISSSYKSLGLNFPDDVPILEAANQVCSVLESITSRRLYVDASHLDKANLWLEQMNAIVGKKAPVAPKVDATQKIESPRQLVTVGMLDERVWPEFTWVNSLSNPARVHINNLSLFVEPTATYRDLIRAVGRSMVPAEGYVIKPVLRQKGFLDSTLKPIDIPTDVLDYVFNADIPVTKPAEPQMLESQIEPLTWTNATKGFSNKFCTGYIMSSSPTVVFNVYLKHKTIGFQFNLGGWEDEYNTVNTVVDALNRLQLNLPIESLAPRIAQCLRKCLQEPTQGVKCEEKELWLKRLDINLVHQSYEQAVARERELRAGIVSGNQAIMDATPAEEKGTVAEPKLRTSPWYTQKLKPQEELYCRLLSIDGIAVDTEPFLAGSNISKENLFKLMRAGSWYLIPSDAECSVVFFPAETDGSYDPDVVEPLYERMDVFATPSGYNNRWSPLYGDLLPESFNLHVSAKFGGYAQGETFAVTATEEDVWTWVKARAPSFNAKALEVTLTPNQNGPAPVIPFQAKQVTLKVKEPAPVAPEPASVPLTIPKVNGQIPDDTLCVLEFLNVNGVELTNVHMGTRQYKDRKKGLMATASSYVHAIERNHPLTDLDPENTGMFDCKIAIKPPGYEPEVLQVRFKVMTKEVTMPLESKEPTVTTSAKTSDLIIEGLEMGAVSALIERGARKFLEKTGGDASNPAVLQSAKITTVLLLRHIGLPLMGDKLPNKDFAERRIDMALKGVTTTATHSSLMELMDVMGPMMSLLSQEGPALLGMLGSMDFAAMKEPVGAKSAV